MANRSLETVITIACYDAGVSHRKVREQEIGPQILVYTKSWTEVCCASLRYEEIVWFKYLYEYTLKEFKI